MDGLGKMPPSAHDCGILLANEKVRPMLYGAADLGGNQASERLFRGLGLS